MKIVPLRMLSKIMERDRLIEICETYFQGKWYTSEKFGCGIHIPFKDLWAFEGPERSWRFQHHALASVSHLVDGFIETQDHKYLDFSKKIIFNWYEVNYPESPSDMGWHDHSTAIRVVNICRFFTEWQHSPDFNEKDFLLLQRIVQIHCEKLADPKFYMLKHNHGLDQDMALFTASMLFHQMSGSERWGRLALNRFERQLNHLFGEDGSYSEHSPHYAYLLLGSLYGFLDFMYQIEHWMSRRLAKNLDKIFAYLVYIIQPNGFMPSIGDSENVLIDLDQVKDWKPNSQIYDFMEQLVTNSKELTQQDDVLPLDKAFMDTGFAQVRSKWFFDQDTTQIMMYSGFHSRVHKHYDDLSFLLFNKGLPLITEGGKYNYEYQTLERQYIVSPYAHNSVMVDEKPANIFAQNVEKSGLLSTLFTKNISYVSGMHALYPEINHRRMFVYFKPDVLVVIDKLDGIKDHCFDTFFNLHWELECRQENQAFYGYLNNEKAIKIDNIFSNDKNIERSVSKGEVNPLKGWLSSSYGEIAPNPLIQYRVKGKAARNIYQISLGTSLKQEEEVQASWEGNVVRLAWRSYKLDINLTDFYEHIYIKDRYYRTNKVAKPELIEAVMQNESKQFEGLWKDRKEYRINRFLFE